MNELELQGQHPDRYAAVFAKGEASERDRVNAHLALAKRSGEMATALECIASGEGITGATMGLHLDARMRKLEARERQLESDAAGAIVDGAMVPAGDGALDLGDLVADRICGKKVEAAE